MPPLPGVDDATPSSARRASVPDAQNIPAGPPSHPREAEALRTYYPSINRICVVRGTRRRVRPSHLIDGSVQCYVSLELLDEIRDVLRRPKFDLSPEQVLTLVEVLHKMCEIVRPTTRVRVVSDDPDDKLVLECALPQV